MSNSKKYKSITNHYSDCLSKYGDNHLGMDWPKLEDVEKRYQIMYELITMDKTPLEKATLLDFGCGTSHFYEYLIKNKHKNIVYSGLDISQEPVNISKNKFPENNYYAIDILDKSDELPNFDYIIMNGVFTEKIDLTFDEMWQYTQEMLSIVFKKAKKGLAFNTMSKAVDWERADLFHLPADLLINFITKQLNRDFIIRNDYGLYEYTTYIYK